MSYFAFCATFGTRIDEALRREQRRRGASPFELIRLKKLKLRAKDLMRRLAQIPQHG